ncbi:hypothetical protein [Enteractinococcus helveticum]|uniref:Septum formation-related domain-containing protein n=1 Tax=Enteractinococcus helveticum TaxID=1837282 RepID=A0A1B7LVS8_9MICC|nr:hypothetical protein [Enteractinococcus helveticum]OAV59147.1 hypothetical protein A6F49_14740 [Enteractinococcus helveticum]
MTPADYQQNSESESPLSAEDPSTPSRREIRQRRERRSRRTSWIIFFTVLIVVLGIVTFFVYSFSSSNNDNGAEAPTETTTRNPSPGIDGIIAANVAPENFLPGDCLANYTDASQPADIVECSSPHNAQLIGRRLYSGDMTYPGEEELRESSEAFCADIPLLENTQATYSINTSRPSDYTWETEADRRVDCIVSTNDETNFSESLVEEPVVDDQRSEEEQAENPIQTADDAAANPEAEASPTATADAEES